MRPPSVGAPSVFAGEAAAIVGRLTDSTHRASVTSTAEFSIPFEKSLLQLLRSTMT